VEALEHQLVEFLMNLFQTIGWFGVVVIMALESANIPIPSEVTMPLSGWMLVQAEGGTAWQAFLLGGLWGAVGCTVGSIISYWLGAWGGRPLVERYGAYIMIHEEDLEKADRWFARWGDWAAFISRLLPIVRTFISFPAGVMRMRFSSFTILSFVGSFIWCGLLALGGYYLGEHWEQLRAVMRPFDIPIAIAILLAGGYYVYHHVQKGRGHQQANFALAGVLALLVGISSLIAWILPTLGMSLAVVGLFLGFLGRDSSQRKLALIGAALSAIGLLVAAANMIFGFYAI
jgi:membrane protein DedA with SNARE-associated domain